MRIKLAPNISLTTTDINQIIKSLEMQIVNLIKRNKELQAQHTSDQKLIVRLKKEIKEFEYAIADLRRALQR